MPRSSHLGKSKSISTIGIGCCLNNWGCGDGYDQDYCESHGACVVDEQWTQFSCATYSECDAVDSSAWYPYTWDPWCGVDFSGIDWNIDIDVTSYWTDQIPWPASNNCYYATCAPNNGDPYYDVIFLNCSSSGGMGECNNCGIGLESCQDAIEMGGTNMACGSNTSNTYVSCYCAEC